MVDPKKAMLAGFQTGIDNLLKEREGPEKPTNFLLVLEYLTKILKNQTIRYGKPSWKKEAF